MKILRDIVEISTWLRKNFRLEMCLFVIFHAHSPAMPYHQHGRANTLGQAVRSIKNHDKWQLKGRPEGEKKKGFYTTGTMTEV